MLKSLNEEQRKAVLHKNGPMLVTAGPGSGKTHVITARLLYMIRVYQIPPEKIAVITFTKEAAKSMSSRFLKYNQQNLPISFGTFHSFYYQIIRSIPKYSNYRLIHEKEKKYVFSQIFPKENREDKEEVTENVLRAISYYKNTEDIKKTVILSGLENEIFEEYMQKYECEKEKRKIIDFDDMLFLCRKVLQENPVVLQKWTEKYDYYLVDEFQDCNPVQYKILQMLAGRNLFVVGDDDQSIYGFRGADHSIMQRFLEDYKEAEYVVLGRNYRCGASVVRASSWVIQENKLRMPKELTSNRLPAQEEYVRIQKWQEKKEMFTYFQDMFKKLEKERLQEHALLFRTNQEMQMCAVELAKSNIPFQMKDKNESIYEHYVVKDILAFLQVANGNRERKNFLRILNKPRGNIGREALEEEIVDLEKIKAFYQNKYMRNPAAVREAEDLERHLIMLKKLSLSLAIRYIRKAMNYEKYLYQRSERNPLLFEGWLELLDWLQQDAVAFQTLQAWENYQKEYKVKMGSKTERKTGVNIMTMHASKGLEFEHCYILNVNDGVIPKYQKGQKLTQEQIEEERRIFYVGMTRAKKTLELHYLTGTKEHPKFPSRFIEVLLK